MLGKTVENRSRVLNHVSRTWEDVGETLLELRRLGLGGRGCAEPNVVSCRECERMWLSPHCHPKDFGPLFAAEASA